MKPFVAERWIYLDGKLVGKEITTYDQDGALAIASTPIYDPSQFIIRTVERPDGFTAKILDSEKLISSGYTSSVRHLTDRAAVALAGCPASSRSIVIGRQSMWGLEVIGIQTIGPDTVRTTKWRAPAIGCFEVTNTFEKQSADGSWITRSEYRTNDLSMGARADLFVVPSGYAEVRPSVLNRQVSSMLGRPLPPESADSNFDADYVKLSRVPIR